MITPQLTMLSATAATSYSSSKRQMAAAFTEKTADTTAISQAAKDRLVFEIDNPSGTPSASPYRVEGPVYSLEEIANNKGRPLFAVKMTEAQSNEVALREQQDRAREIANANYAKGHQYQPVGQVLVGGKVFSTVFDAGSFEIAHALPGLNNSSLNPAGRLAEIARAVKGEIISSGFLPTLGGGGGPRAPESELQSLTARSLMEIMDQEIRPAMEKKVTEWEMQTGKTYPRRP